MAVHKFEGTSGGHENCEYFFGIACLFWRLVRIIFCWGSPNPSTPSPLSLPRYGSRVAGTCYCLLTTKRSNMGCSRSTIVLSFCSRGKSRSGSGHSGFASAPIAFRGPQATSILTSFAAYARFFKAQIRSKGMMRLILMQQVRL